MSDSALNEIPANPPAGPSELRIYQLDPITDPRWEFLVQRDPAGSIFHSGAWLRALKSCYSYEPVAFTTSRPEEELANGIVFCRIHSWLTGSRLVSLSFSDYCEPLCRSTGDLESLIRHLQGELERHGHQRLQVRPVSGLFGEIGARNGWLPSDEFFLHNLDLEPSPSELFESFDKDSVQRRIQRAERAGLVEKCGNSEALLRDFYKLFVLTRRRQGVPATPYRWFRCLAGELGKALNIRAAYKDGIPVAAIFTLSFKDTVYYKYGCSDSRFNSYGATPWLFWQAITAAKLSAATRFDFGRTELSNLGLLTFKNHWVSHPERITYWQYPSRRAQSSAESWKRRLGKRMFSLAPAFVNAAIGNLLYRHFG
jgi:hypothetical protein